MSQNLTNISKTFTYKMVPKTSWNEMTSRYHPTYMELPRSKKIVNRQWSHASLESLAVSLCLKAALLWRRDSAALCCELLSVEGKLVLRCDGCNCVSIGSPSWRGMMYRSSCSSPFFTLTRSTAPQSPPWGILTVHSSGAMHRVLTSHAHSHRR